MPDKKLTDKEIIKDLKFCEDCSANINIDIIDLINRQKSEIDSAKAKIEICAEVIERQDKEIERLKYSTVVNNIMESQRIKREAKVEAYKEFADKLENEINCRATLSRQQDKNVIRIMHNLVKEMVGDDNA